MIAISRFDAECPRREVVDDEQERAKPLGVILSSEVHGVRTS